MDEAKVAFLFGADLGGRDPDRPEDRAQLLADANPELTHNDLAIWEAVATQVAQGRPREVWQVAQAMLAEGFQPDDVFAQLTFAFGHEARAAAQNDVPFDTPAYVASLGFLPLPQPADVGPVIVEVVREQPGISGDDIDLLVLQRLGRDADDALTTDLVGRIAEALTQDEEPLAWLGGDRTVHVGDLVAGAVLTHRLSEEDAASETLLTLDLAPFNRTEGLHLEGGQEITAYPDDQDLMRWAGPPGWLASFVPGSVLAVRVSPQGLVALASVEEPVADALLISRLRRVYEQEVDESDLPASLEEIVLGLLLDDPATFATARPPLTELCGLAGLERRGDMVAHDPSYWRHQYRLEGLRRVLDYFEEDSERMAVLRALDAADNAEASALDLRAALAGMREREVCTFVIDELFGPDDDPQLLAGAGEFTERLLKAARQPGDVAVARLLAAVVAERRGKVLDAEALIRSALDADPDWPPAIDRAAWYAFDRGNAGEAARLWRRIEDPPAGDLNLLEGFVVDPHPGLGRNDPCWCGSGRKYKACHLGRTELPPLPERFAWLCRKATAFLERRGVGPDALLLRHGEARALDDDPDSIAEALNDPIVADVTLVEGGWFARFLADRGPLLPDDEARLAASWNALARTVYEVVEVRPGAGVTLRDLRDDASCEVWEPDLSTMATSGLLLCGRAVPDGRTKRFMGRVFPVIPGTEADVLALCDGGLTEDLCQYVGLCLLPPKLVTKEGEGLVQCSAVLSVPDPAQAREVLQQHYQATGPGWQEYHTLESGETIVRARLTLTGDRLSVVSHSAERLDRVLAVLRGAIPRLQVHSEQRQPITPEDLDEAPLDSSALPHRA